MTILVTGARGSIGGAVLSDLLADDETVRASSRDPQPGDFPDAVEVVQADLSEPKTFPGLLDGVRKVFLYANPDAVTEFTKAAREAGVEHIVLLSSNSVVFPDAAGNPIAVLHMTVEQALRESGIDWTFVRPGYLATNTLRWTSIRTERVLRTAFPESSVPLVHERDVAGIAVRALRDDRHRGQSYLVLGGEPLSVRQQVAAIADALGEPVRVDQVDVETYRAELLTQLPAVIADRFIQLAGQIPQVPADVRVDAVPLVLGRPPLTYAEWAREHAAGFR